MYVGLTQVEYEQASLPCPYVGRSAPYLPLPACHICPSERAIGTRNGPSVRPPPACRETTFTSSHFHDHVYPWHPPSPVALFGTPSRGRLKRNTDFIWKQKSCRETYDSSSDKHVTNVVFTLATSARGHESEQPLAAAVSESAR